MLESLSKGNQSVMRGKAVATRLRLLGSDDPNSRNERAEGLCDACASDTPSGDGTLGCVNGIYCRSVGSDAAHSLCPWLAAMRLEVAARKSGFLPGGGLTTYTRVASRIRRSVRLRFFFVGTMDWSYALRKTVQNGA